MSVLLASQKRKQNKNKAMFGKTLYLCKIIQLSHSQRFYKSFPANSFEHDYSFHSTRRVMEEMSIFQ